jgi:hypothetical protein
MQHVTTILSNIAGLLERQMNERQAAGSMADLQ